MQKQIIKRIITSTTIPRYVPPGGRFLARNLPRENLLQVVLFPAVIILHKDSVLGIGGHWGIVLGSVPLDVLISVGIVVLIWIVVLVRIVLIVRI